MAREEIGREAREQLLKLAESKILSPNYLRVRLLIWSVRALVELALYILFWEYSWVPWSLCVVVPIEIVSLVLIIMVPKLLQKKIEQVRQQVDRFERGGKPQ